MIVVTKGPGGGDGELDDEGGRGTGRGDGYSGEKPL